MEDTLWKFNEAVYFLNQMKKNSQDRDSFTFNLSAFLSASRSITLIMQEELSSHPKFSEWYIGKKQYMKQDDDFSFFNNLRVDTIHKKIVKPLYTIRAGPFTVRGNTTIEIPLGVLGDKGKMLPSYDYMRIDGVPHPEIQKPPVKMGFTFDGRFEKSVIELCQTYIEKIRTFITEWQSSSIQAPTNNQK